MLSSNIPTKFPIPFAASAGGSFIRSIPVASQIGIQDGAASLTDGFVPDSFLPLASGGIPPYGADFNGLLKQVTQWLQWAAAGGLPVRYDATFSTAIGGYPMGALIQSATQDRYWISATDNNTTNPDAAGAGWLAFPDVIVQKQAGNYAVDTGTPNNYTITLTPAPASIAAIVGSPLRIKIGAGSGPNTIVNPVIHINAATGSTTAVMVNSSGAPLLIGQLSRVNQIFEGYLDGDGFFQVTSPAPIVGGVASAVQTGVIYEWPAEIPPSWGLECNGAVYNISAYPNLYNVIRGRFGGDNVNTFAVPDKRGAFTRGWDHGRGLDPGASTRTTLPNGGGSVVGDHVGSWEAQAIGPATFIGPALLSNCHATPWDNISPDMYLGDSGGRGNWSTQGAEPGGVNGYMFDNQLTNGSPQPTPGTPSSVSLIKADLIFGPTTGAETRPVNIDMMYVIAF